MTFGLIDHGRKTKSALAAAAGDDGSTKIVGTDPNTVSQSAEKNQATGNKHEEE